MEGKIRKIEVFQKISEVLNLILRKYCKQKITKSDAYLVRYLKDIVIVIQYKYDFKITGESPIKILIIPFGMMTSLCTLRSIRSIKSIKTLKDR